MSFRNDDDDDDDDVDDVGVVNDSDDLAWVLAKEPAVCGPTLNKMETQQCTTQWCATQIHKYTNIYKISKQSRSQHVVQSLV